MTFLSSCYFEIANHPQDANGTVFVKDLVSVPVSSVDEIMEVVAGMRWICANQHHI